MIMMIVRHVIRTFIEVNYEQINPFIKSHFFIYYINLTKFNERISATMNLNDYSHSRAPIK